VPKKKRTKKKPLSFKVYKGDCREVMPRRVEPGSAKLAILDPPYNLGKDYEAFLDKAKVADFKDWLYQCVDVSLDCLHRHGTLWLFMSDHLVSEIDVMLKTRLGLVKRSHVIWYYTFGENAKKNFTPSHTHLLYYVKTKTQYTFEPDNPALRHPSARQVKYKDKRANPKGRLPDNTWAIFPELMPDGFDPAGDTWLASRVCGTFNEREKASPNQIPVPLMERIVMSTSRPGDLVVDPFCGTGSSGIAAKLHGRNYVGCDLSDSCCKQSRRRIASANPGG